MFGIALDEQKEGDQSITIADQKFVIESELVEIYKTFTVDYSDSWYGKGFMIRPQMGGSSC